MSDASYAGLPPDAYQHWSSSFGPSYSTNPVADIERFMAACKKDDNRQPSFRPLMIHCSEWPKARDGQVFYAEGAYWRWTDRDAPPVFVGFEKKEDARDRT